jgi:hypothetical protein
MVRHGMHTELWFENLLENSDMEDREDRRITLRRIFGKYKCAVRWVVDGIG